MTSKRQGVVFFLALFFVWALIAQRLTIVAVGLTLAGFTLSISVRKLDGLRWGIANIVLLSWVAMLFLHIAPGFHNLSVLDHVTKSQSSAPFSLFLNMDKPLAFFTLWLAYPGMMKWHRNLQWQGLVLGIGIVVMVLPTAFVMGLIDVDVSLPSWWWLFAINNLFFTCVAEEALFRGYLQSNLVKRYGAVVGILVASVIFGIAHFPGGVAFIVFATLAGIGYGLCYFSSGRLWFATLIHFLLNFCHLGLFTYPFLSQ